MQSIWFAEEIFSTHVRNTPSRPGLFLSARPEFLERGEGFNKFAGDGPSKKRVSIVSCPVLADISNKGTFIALTMSILISIYI